MEFDQETWRCIGVHLPEWLRPVSMLGQGGCGIVVRARLKTGVRPDVACKIALEGGEGRVENERVMLRRLNGVRGVPKLLEWDEGGTPLICDIIDGQTMDEYFRRESVTIGEALRLIARLAGTLAQVHARGIVHRDVKPQNVLVRQGVHPCPVLIDFGLSAPIDEGPLDTHISGTLIYMPPEAFHPSTRPSPAQDIYALGVMLFQACAGYAPFRGENLMEMFSLHHLAPIPELPPAFGARLNALLKSSLEKSPQLRLASANAFAMALSEAMGEMDSQLMSRRVTRAESLHRSRGPTAVTEFDVR